MENNRRQVGDKWGTSGEQVGDKSHTSRQVADMPHQCTCFAQGLAADSPNCQQDVLTLQLEADSPNH